MNKAVPLGKSFDEEVAMIDADLPTVGVLGEIHREMSWFKFLPGQPLPASHRCGLPNAATKPATKTTR